MQLLLEETRISLCPVGPSICESSRPDSSAKETSTGSNRSVALNIVRKGNAVLKNAVFGKIDVPDIICIISGIMSESPIQFETVKIHQSKFMSTR